MSTPREEILARIRAVERVPAPAAPRDYRRRGALDADARARLFAERVADYRGDVRDLAPGDVATAVASVCREHRASRIVVPAGFPAAWRPTAIGVLEDDGLPARELDAVGAVATACTVAIAQTGTIVLTAGPAEGRRALTLVPDLHVCVLRRDQIVELVPEAFAALAEAVAERRPLTLVSGPSATSDIELSRVEGVHGPRTLVVLVVDGGAPPAAQ